MNRRQATLSAAVALTVGASSVFIAPAAVAGGDHGRGQSHSHRHQQVEAPLVVGHRGASGYRPEHTLASYELAAQMGADYIEPDLVSTQDGVLVARHENFITDTTDVAERPEFADRKTTKVIDGTEMTGWFTEDFTLAELKTLRAQERLPGQRPGNTAYDGQFEVPTFEEVLQLREELSEELGYEIGIAPEIKHPTYFDGLDLSMEEGVVELLEEYGLNERRAPVYVQSFELDNLKDLNRNLDLDAPSVFLSGVNGSPYDSVEAGDERRDYDYYESGRGMKEIRRSGVDGLGPALGQVITQNEDGSTGEDTGFVDRAHRNRLEVTPYTFRAENQYLYSEFRSSEDRNEHGDLHGMIQMFLDVGVDGFFTDHPDLGAAAVGEWAYEQGKQRGQGHRRH
jgi:glycerophosphoryl diester phosphodiesterase